MLTNCIYRVRRRCLSEERGQSTVEFAAILTVVVVVITVLSATGDEIRELFRAVARLLYLL